MASDHADIGDAPRYLGNFAACEPWAAVGMSCADCNVSWTGCWDNFECPICRKGELPSEARHFKARAG